MKDLFGVEIEVGMMVGYTTRGRYNYTMRGKVVRLTAKRVWVSDHSDPDGLVPSPLHPELLTVSITSHVRPILNVKG